MICMIYSQYSSTAHEPDLPRGADRCLICRLYSSGCPGGGSRMICVALHVLPGLDLYWTDRPCTACHSGRVGSETERYGATMLISPIFPFSTYLRAQRRFSRRAQNRTFSRKKRSELSSRGFQHTFPLAQGYRNSFLRRGKIHPVFPNSLCFALHLPQDPEKVKKKIGFTLKFEES